MIVRMMGNLDGQHMWHLNDYVSNYFCGDRPSEAENLQAIPKFLESGLIYPP